MELEELKNTLDAQTTALLNTSKKIEERLKLLAEKEANWSAQVKRAEENASKAKQKIKLDVGGKLFSTSKDTLMRIEGTYFYAMLGSGKFQPDEEGVYFIDRNPKHFDLILDYLRTGEFCFHDMDRKVIEKITKDCDYFQIPLPKEILSHGKTPVWDPSMCSQSLRLSNGNTIVSKDEFPSFGKKHRVGPGWQSGVMCSEPHTSFSVRVLECTSGNVMVGFAPRNGTFQVNGMNHTTCGWYICFANGCLHSQQGDSGRVYGRAIQNGSTLTCSHNAAAGTISFSLDGRDWGVAFNGVNLSPLYPSAEIHDANVRLELV